MIGSIKWLIRRVFSVVNHVQPLCTLDIAKTSRLSSRHMPRYECSCLDSYRKLIGNTNVIMLLSNLNPSMVLLAWGIKFKISNTVLKISHDLALAYPFCSLILFHSFFCSLCSSHTGLLYFLQTRPIHAVLFAKYALT